MGSCMSVLAWAVTTGEVGMRTQARGLAEAVADTVVEKTVRRSLWSTRGEILAPPWPDVLVSCGRRSAVAALAARRRSGPAMITAHVQDPRGQADRFDLVVAMDHDAIAGGAHVIKVATALHDLTPEKLAAAGEIWAPRLASLGRPLAGVAVGGALRGRAFTRADTERLLAGLMRLRAAGVALAITPSRRTPAETRERLAEVFDGDAHVFLWDGQGDNPYRAILALSDRLIVTSDSVSMISEALSAPHPVEVFDLGFARHRDFIGRLVDLKLIGRFTGDSAPPVTRGPVNATQTAGAALRRLLQGRTGVAG
jgi:hypothetical protein